MSSHVAPAPGLVALLGSGETGPVGRKALERLLSATAEPRNVIVLDTPAGFQPNHRRVAGKVAEFVEEKLGSARVRVQVVETRRGDAEDASVIRAIAGATCVFAGPGSPTYMIDELRDTGYLSALRAAHAQGVALCLASAATIAASAQSVPVYEIFKVGTAPFWYEGLDLFSPYGLHVAFVPHWNNQEGGAELDTSCCFMGQKRFEQLHAQLPKGLVLLGIDEHTGCVLDFAANQVEVIGNGAAHVIRDEQIRHIASGEGFSLDLLRTDATIESGNDAFSLANFLATVTIADEDDVAPEESSGSIPGGLIDTLLEIRTELRTAKQYALADRLRGALTEAGVILEDTPEGPRWHLEG